MYNYKITYEDIQRWIENMQGAIIGLRDLQDRTESEADKVTLRSAEYALSDGLYLVALVECLMTLNEPEGTLERAKELQNI